MPSNYLITPLETNIHNEITELDLSGKTLVIAEDDLFCFEYLKQLLRKTGIEIRHAKNGNELMQILDQQEPDLLLLDVQMPEKDGHDCLVEMRAKGIKTKVIVQTASDVFENRERIMLAGADSYISKPIRKQKLFHLIDSVLNGRK